MLRTVSPKKYYSFMIDHEMAAALKRVKERDGIAESEQIRRGITLWLQSKGVIKAERKRPARRPRS